MIVNWKQNRVLVAGDLQLLPGNNQVDNDRWAAVRPSLSGHIAAKNIVEVNAKTEKVGSGDDVKLVVTEKLPFEKLEPEAAEAIVKETYDLKTLAGWKKVEGRESVRAAISEQIDLVKSTSTKKE